MPSPEKVNRDVMTTKTKKEKRRTDAALSSLRIPSFSLHLTDVAPTRCSTQYKRKIKEGRKNKEKEKLAKRGIMLAYLEIL